MEILVLFTFIGAVFTFDSPQVTISQGSLVGTTFTTRGGREIFGFLGIPYAAPPTGHLRFQSPQDPPTWPGLRDASRPGSACIQQFVLIEKLRNIVIGLEDCLFLNVYTPQVTEKLPVMFYIHGGGYAGGSGDPSEYGPELLLDQDVVLVTINYRLGPLGFLSTGDSVLPGNLGLKDQLSALKWVQKNIHHFGGDKDSVTIFGESAGGASVHFHMLSPKSQGLFHKAISQSGTALCPWAISTAARHRELAAQLAQLTGCSFTSSQELVDCLRALPAQDIVGTLKHFIVWDMDPVVLFNPAVEPEEVEDAFLTSNPWTLTSQVPWMVGFNENEGALKLAGLTQGNVPEKFKKLNEDFDQVLPLSLLYQHTSGNTKKVTKAIRQFYFGKTERITLAHVPELVKLYTDSWFSHGVSEASRMHDGPVFFYYFTYNNSESFSLCNHYFGNPHFMGVCHFDELLYLFPMDSHAPKLIIDNPDYQMSTKMIQLWTNFAEKRIPFLYTSEDFWKSKNGSKEEYLEISAEGFRLQSNLLKERIQFWQTLPLRGEAVRDEF
ncbi:esterase FE4-like isoform X1 [Macrosteles quadrilineatus]|uniref:esterase FE4-like isoform X1 n=1 Tax=Macrosteles quadrilineatus TaxID=74068 RepID=UPI0023E13601|nr:esterase FE4-like isoform X1 [Macrosteles quadrilineatus]